MSRSKNRFFEGNKYQQIAYGFDTSSCILYTHWETCHSSALGSSHSGQKIAADSRCLFRHHGLEETALFAPLSLLKPSLWFSLQDLSQRTCQRTLSNRFWCPLEPAIDIVGRRCSYCTHGAHFLFLPVAAVLHNVHELLGVPRERSLQVRSYRV